MGVDLPDFDDLPVTAGPVRRGLPVGWEVFFAFIVALGASLVDDKICLVVQAGLICALVLRHRANPASVLGIVFCANCEAPLLRRIHDLHHGFTQGSPILVASYCAFPVLGVIILRDLSRFRRIEFVPMVLAWIGVLWAFGVGCLNAGIQPAAIQLLQYCAGPIIFAYVVANAERLDIKLLCRWLLVLGTFEAVYGIYQWASPPAWDLAWFNGSGMSSSGGVALPFQLRTFGTLNSVSPYAYFLFFILVVAVTSPKYLFVSPVIVAALATTQGRSTWGATVVGWTIALFLAKSRERGKLLWAIGGTIGIALLMALPFSSRVVDLTHRFQTIGNLQQDNSFKGRSGLLDAALDGGALEDPVGVGFGMTGAAARASGTGLGGIDNGFLQTLWIFGWTGSLFYLGGFLWGLGVGLSRRRLLDAVRIPFLGAVVALFASNLFESAFDDMKGVMLWASLGIVTTRSFRTGNGNSERD